MTKTVERTNNRTTAESNASESRRSARLQRPESVAMEGKPGGRMARRLNLPVSGVNTNYCNLMRNED
jgi:hypothetical protein